MAMSDPAGTSRDTFCKMCFSFTLTARLRTNRSFSRIGGDDSMDKHRSRTLMSTGGTFWKFIAVWLLRLNDYWTYAMSVVFEDIVAMSVQPVPGKVNVWHRRASLAPPIVVAQAEINVVSPPAAYKTYRMRVGVYSIAGQGIHAWFLRQLNPVKRIILGSQFHYEMGLEFRKPVCEYLNGIIFVLYLVNGLVVNVKYFVIFAN